MYLWLTEVSVLEKRVGKCHGYFWKYQTLKNIHFNICRKFLLFVKSFTCSGSVALLLYKWYSLLSICFYVQMRASDQDSGVNGQLSYSLVYELERNRVFGVRPHESNPSIAILYTLKSFDRESSSGYGAFRYNGTVTLKVSGRYWHCSCSIRYDTIRDAISTCARKPTWVSLIYRT